MATQSASGTTEVRDVTEPFTAYRVMKSNDPKSAAYLNSLRSNYERGKPFRPKSIEEQRTIFHMGISMFQTEEVAAEMARRFKLGKFVARVEMAHGSGFNFTEASGPRGHMTVWGRPAQLALAIADIYPV
jgi:hypothetical protein